MTGIKPHIRKVDGGWACGVSFADTWRAKTPAVAYRAWELNSKPVLCDVALDVYADLSLRKQIGKRITNMIARKFNDRRLVITK